jgi:hypothetical protein
MNIKGMNIKQISRKLEMYVSAYYKDFKLSAGQCLLSESYIFDFEEIKHLIPEQYHQQLNDKKFNGMSGGIEFDPTPNDSEIILMLITDENNSTLCFCWFRSRAILTIPREIF